MASFIEVDYRFPASVDAKKQAQVIAVGQTAGSWDARYTHAEPSLRAHLAEVVKVHEQVATVRFPAANVEGDIASLLTMIFGKYSMAGPARVIDVRLPKDYGTAPRHGLAGIRKLVGVQDRPLIMAIFKPALGLSAADHALILRAVAEAGLDIIKDDEILPNLPTAPTMERLVACRAVLDDVKAKTGRTVLYAVNVTGRADQVLSRARELVAAGANALLFNVLTHGYSVLESLARDPAVNVPIFAHPALAGALSGGTDFGLDYAVVLGTLMAHAGADAVLYPARYGALSFDAVQEQRIKEALRARGVAAAPSAGIHPGVVPQALADYGQDVILNAGSGVMDHPSGMAAGVRAFFEALALAKPGVLFMREAIAPGPLRAALDKWGCG